jgi:hypothetical protein
LQNDLLRSYVRNVCLLALFYVALSFGLFVITLVVNTYHIPESGYDLNAGNPATILIAPFVNGTWQHLLSSCVTLGVLVPLLAIVPPLTSWGFVGLKSFWILATAGPSFAGIGAATLFILVNPQSGGAGSSIITAALAGMITVFYAAAMLRDLRAKRFFWAISPGFLLLAVIYYFATSFFPSGNVPAHLSGLSVGLLLGLAYHRFSPSGASDNLP